MIESFLDAGGRCIVEAAQISEKLKNIKAFISDWDGVFNNGIKNPQIPSSFSESDSMGTNLLRYGFWKRNNQIPAFAIITGASNPTAIDLAKRERFSAVYSQMVFKEEAVRHFCQMQEIEPEQVACFFDDANDLGMARICGLRFLIKRKATPAFTSFVIKNQLCDYTTAQEGGEHALREVCELILTLQGDYESVLMDRGNFVTEYQDYYAQRQASTTTFYRKEGNFFVEMEA
jgi:3-deoxy-D-manno-octulosonate 8-phosphate phosphatase (KDO 8-P phosphatase)